MDLSGSGITGRGRKVGGRTLLKEQIVGVIHGGGSLLGAFVTFFEERSRISHSVLTTSMRSSTRGLCALKLRAAVNPSSLELIVQGGCSDERKTPPSCSFCVCSGLVSAELWSPSAPLLR